MAAAHVVLLVLSLEFRLQCVDFVLISLFEIRVREVGGHGLAFRFDGRPVLGALPFEGRALRLEGRPLPVLLLLLGRFARVDLPELLEFALDKG